MVMVMAVVMTVVGAARGGRRLRASGGGETGEEDGEGEEGFHRFVVRRDFVAC